VRVSLQILGTRPDPTLDYRAGSPELDRIRVVAFTGEVQIGPPPGSGIRFATGSDEPSAILGFYVPEAQPFPPAVDLQVQGEIALARLTVTTGGSAHHTYGLGHPTVRLVADQDGSGAVWPYLEFAVYGAFPMVARYRVTATHRVD
jgi:hypothetical protein